MLVLKGHRGRLRCLAFSPEGRLLASAAGKGTAVSLWDTTRGKRIGFLKGNTTRMACLAFAPGPTGLLATAPVWGAIRLWDTNVREMCGTVSLDPQRGPGAMIFAPDGSTLVLGQEHHQGYRVSLWDMARRQVVGRLIAPRSRTLISSTIYSLAFNPGGKELAVGSDRCVDLWDVPARQRRLHLPILAPVRGLAYSPDGLTLAFSARHKVTLWDLATNTSRAELSHKLTVNSLKYSPDGRTLMTAGNDGIVHLWEVDGSRERAAYDWQLGVIHVVAFAPDAMRAAAGGETDIVVWDLDDAG